MITVIGSINLDLIATTGRLPGPGETVGGKSFSTAPGGKGANQALAARRAGADVSMVGAAGRDSFAGDALALMKDAGVDLSGVAKTDEATGVALILVGGDGENMIAVVPGANGTMTAERAREAVADLPDNGIVLLQLEIPEEAVEAALGAAQDRGLTSILNLAPFTDAAAGLASLATILIANETEFSALTGKNVSDADGVADAAADYSATHGQTMIVTLGAEGAVVAENGTVARVASPKIDPVDTVGAGDTFCGYLAHGLSSGMTLEEAVARAVRAGALACLKPGAQPAIPTADEVETFQD